MVQSPTCPHGIFIDLRIQDGSLTPKRCIEDVERGGEVKTATLFFGRFKVGKAPSLSDFRVG